MVTYFNKKDLVNFGNYLLSDKRKATIHSIEPEKLTTTAPHDRQDLESVVYHSDIANWLESQQKED